MKNLYFLIQEKVNIKPDPWLHSYSMCMEEMGMSLDRNDTDRIVRVFGRMDRIREVMREVTRSTPCYWAEIDRIVRRRGIDLKP